MTESMRQSTLQTLGLGTVLDIFRQGRLPADTADLVDRVFGEAGDRGSLVVSGAQGIVGSGKTMQLGSRLEPYGVPVVALDFPGAPKAPRLSARTPARYDMSRRSALERLARELPATLFYHSLWHTQEEVTAAAEKIAAEQGFRPRRSPEN